VADLTGTRHLRRRRCHSAVLLVTFAAAVIGFCIDSVPTFGQVNTTLQLHFPPRPRPPNPPVAPSNAPMLVQSDELKYDYTNNVVAAVGNVQIYYRGSTIEADKVVYDEKTKRMTAEGNARLTEPDGRITFGQVIDLTDDYRDGFVDSLRLDMPNDSHFAAVRADRTNGSSTVMQNGVYTACEPCQDDPKKPPEWQIRAERIIHDQNEKMIYFEDGTVDLFGLPVAWFPFLSAPDPTVKRKSGFLFPTLTTSTVYGYGIQTPYYFDLAPNYDFTLYPRYMTQQGLLMEGEWNQRLSNGFYTIKAAGIFQQDPGVFASEYGAGTPATDSFRGTFLTAGQFNITNHWLWGWTGVLQTDPTFQSDYGLTRFGGANVDPFRTGVDLIASNIGPGGQEAVSQLYLVGSGARSYFDIRSIYYYGYSVLDQQSQLPVIHPVLDYSNVMSQQVLGGDVSYKINLTSLTRQEASYDPISEAAVNDNICANGLAETTDAALLNKSNCLLRGIPGTYSRASAEVDWRSTVITANGQMFTPFVRLQGDVASAEIDNQPGVSNYITPGDSNLVRAMPAVGVEYRYPFVDIEPWGTQTIQPIAQLILRPNETDIGKFPNEDSQSLIFDDTNLFSIDKYSGWDRVEGGGRLNAGLEYTGQVNQAGFVDALFGQSYQLYGLNSFAVGDITNTGLESGLDKPISDYVGRVSYQPNSTYMFNVRARFDEATFAVERLEVETRANFDRLGLELMYGDDAAQPELGFLTRREGITGGASYKLTQNLVVFGSAGYDIFAQQFNASRIGVGYVDDCLMMAVVYNTSYAYNGTTSPVPNKTVFFQLSLRTLGPDNLNASGY
jgi:LPS-assembly protein